MCAFKRKTLDAAKGTDQGAEAIKAVLGGQMPGSFNDAKLTCDSISQTFNAASAIAAQANRGRAMQPRYGNNGQGNGFSKPPTIAEMNKRNAEHYAKQQ
jgi:hypothetical protein